MESRQKKLCEKINIFGVCVTHRKSFITLFWQSIRNSGSRCASFCVAKIRSWFKPKNHQRHFNRFENGAEIWGKK